MDSAYIALVKLTVIWVVLALCAACVWVRVGMFWKKWNSDAGAAGIAVPAEEGESDAHC